MDVIEEVFDFLLYVHVVDEEILGTFQCDRRKVDDAFAAGFLQGVHHPLRGGFRHGERSHTDRIGGDEILYVFNMQDWNRRIGIEDGGNAAGS